MRWKKIRHSHRTGSVPRPEGRLLTVGLDPSDDQLRHGKNREHLIHHGPHPVDVFVRLLEIVVSSCLCVIQVEALVGSKKLEKIQQIVAGEAHLLHDLRHLPADAAHVSLAPPVDLVRGEVGRGPVSQHHAVVLFPVGHVPHTDGLGRQCLQLLEICDQVIIGRLDIAGQDGFDLDNYSAGVFSNNQANNNTDDGYEVSNDTTGGGTAAGNNGAGNNANDTFSN